jgi:hypothetical protein
MKGSTRGSEGCGSPGEFHAPNFWLSRPVRLRYSGCCSFSGDSLRKGHDDDYSFGWR